MNTQPEPRRCKPGDLVPLRGRVSMVMHLNGDTVRAFTISSALELVGESGGGGGGSSNKSVNIGFSTDLSLWKCVEVWKAKASVIGKEMTD